MSRVFRDHGCAVVGVEIDPEAASRATAACERVIQGDLDCLDLERELGDDRFDVVVAADVLEHLKDPLRVARSLTRLLRQDGYFVVSIPNVAHGSVRLALLGGHFRYTEQGLLDRTHLRFFTLQSIEDLLDAAGYEIVHLERQQQGIHESEVPVDPSAVPAELLERLVVDREALTYQYILVACPVSPARRELNHIRIRELRQELDSVRRQLVDLEARTEAHRDEAHALRTAIAERDLRVSLLSSRVAEVKRDLAQETIARRHLEKRLLEWLLELRASPPGRIYRAVRHTLRRIGGT
jgi:SAM-dependent methyltransferase